MTGKDVVDRRKTGVHTTRITDGNGGQFDLVTVAASKVKVIAGAVSAILVLIGAVFGAVRFGVSTEVHKQIDSEAVNENGAIHMQIDRCIEKHQEVVEEKFDEDFDKLDTRLQEQKLMGARTEEQLQALDRKVDANQEELLRAIERVGGGNG